ncbi:hypothetical protein [Burkholderia pseudomallei]|uniref:hypothetical protein n=1 Tax=Burkholderia pseudomallei TaxID=28450 RepID=UPI0005320842|nr:hypothetical protein [Burkholderia pseudomallei]KGS30113.1 hypothetical protein X989_6203 [Burkholderia pseudomallei MSHR4378]KGX64923.1 hypothetical protein Y027_6221 [Burkholderia pseudomallei TSV5]
MSSYYTLHIPVFDERFRSVTDRRTGLVSLAKALRLYQPERPRLGSTSIWLGNEFPLYEVVMDDAVYRLLLRETWPGSGKFEPICVAAAGYTTDGVVLAPGPDAIPNMPMALVREIAYVTGNPVHEVADRAHSLRDYRQCYDDLEPVLSSLKPYRFAEWFLLETTGGNVSSLFDTPGGVNSEVWTLLLKLLEFHNAEELMDYAVSEVPSEAGESAAKVMMRALRIRAGHHYMPRRLSSKPNFGA